jgi:hypothetical protein
MRNVSFRSSTLLLAMVAAFVSGCGPAWGDEGVVNGAIVAPAPTASAQTSEPVQRRYLITVAAGSANGSTGAFAVAEPDTNYGVSIVPVDWTGSPAANNFIVKRVFKYTHSVQLDVFTSNAAGTTVTFEVIVVRQ